MMTLRIKETTSLWTNISEKVEAALCGSPRDPVTLSGLLGHIKETTSLWTNIIEKVEAALKRDPPSKLEGICTLITFARDFAAVFEVSQSDLNLTETECNQGGYTAAEVGQVYDSLTHRSLAEQLGMDKTIALALAAEDQARSQKLSAANVTSSPSVPVKSTVGSLRKKVREEILEKITKVDNSKKAKETSQTCSTVSSVSTISSSSKKKSMSSYSKTSGKVPPGGTLGSAPGGGRWAEGQSEGKYL